MNGRKALFLDRDGVINVDHGYVCAPERTEFIDGIFELCRQAKGLGYLLVVITNQAGIGRGYYSEQQYLDYMNWMRTVFQQHSAPLDAVYHCPHHPTDGVGAFRRECDCRKPAPGMLLRAQRDLGLDLARCILIGDKASDMAAGHSAGVGSCILIEPVPGPASSTAQAISPVDCERVMGCFNDVS
jgi:D-glycero-D-manno-heptose 1,7-bisphosphate phosphatase